MPKATWLQAVTQCDHVVIAEAVGTPHLLQSPAHASSLDGPVNRALGDTERQGGLFDGHHAAHYARGELSKRPRTRRGLMGGGVGLARYCDGERQHGEYGDEQFDHASASMIACAVASAASASAAALALSRSTFAAARSLVHLLKRVFMGAMSLAVNE